MEFGAEISLKNSQEAKLLSEFVSLEYQRFLEACTRRLDDVTAGCFNGNYETLNQVIDEHVSNLFPLCTLRSRFIHGSTLLHQCARFGHYDLVEKLLKLNDIDKKPLNPNLRDNNGCTALHLCKNVKIMKLLIDYGAEVNAIDLNGNMPLHLNSLGEKGEPSFLDAIELLLFFKAELRYKNKEVN